MRTNCPANKKEDFLHGGGGPTDIEQLAKLEKKSPRARNTTEVSKRSDK
jgi:hypothetical protein